MGEVIDGFAERRQADRASRDAERAEYCAACPAHMVCRGAADVTARRCMECGTIVVSIDGQPLGEEHDIGQALWRCAAMNLGKLRYKIGTSMFSPISPCNEDHF